MMLEPELQVRGGMSYVDLPVVAHAQGKGFESSVCAVVPLRYFKSTPPCCGVRLSRECMCVRANACWCARFAHATAGTCETAGVFRWSGSRWKPCV